MNDADDDYIGMHMHMALTTAGLKESYVQFKLKLLFPISEELLSANLTLACFAGMSANGSRSNVNIKVRWKLKDL